MYFSTRTYRGKGLDMPTVAIITCPFLAATHPFAEPGMPLPSSFLPSPPHPHPVCVHILSFIPIMHQSASLIPVSPTPPTPPTFPLPSPLSPLPSGPHHVGAAPLPFVLRRPSDSSYSYPYPMSSDKWQKAARKVQAVNRVTAKTKMWLDALHDNLTSLRTISSLFCLGNVLGDGDFRLVVAGLDRRLRVFQGATVSSDSTLVDLPSSIAIFTPPGGRGHTPRSHVAVAIGPSLFIYDHLRPIHRYTLPTLPVSDEERRIWSALEEGEESGNGTEGGGGAPAANMDGPSSSPSPSSPTTTITGFDHAVAKLAHLQEMGHVVCPRSMRLLALESPEAQHNFVLMTMGAALEHPTSTITAVHAVCSTSPSNPETQLVVGTENGRLLLLDALATRAEAILQIGHAAVVTMGSTGALGEVGSSSSSSCTCRVAVLTRNARVHVVGGRLAKVTATMALSAPGVALTCHLDFVVIACMDESIQCFGLDGARRFSVFTGSPILALASMPAAQVR